jgi:hypothetical protein
VCVAQAGASSIPHAPPENGRQNSREIFSTVFSFLLLPRMFRFFSLGRLGIVDRIFTSWPCARVLICLIFMGGIIRRYLQCATRLGDHITRKFAVYTDQSLTTQERITYEGKLSFFESAESIPRKTAVKLHPNKREKSWLWGLGFGG